MRKFLSITMIILLLATGVHMGVNVYSAQKAQETQEQTTEATTSVVEPEIVEAPEFSEDETTTTAAPEPTTKRAPVKKTVAETTTAPAEEFAEVSEVAVFSQQEIFVEEPAEEETVTEETTEEATGYEPVYDDPLPPEGADWIE